MKTITPLLYQSGYVTIKKYDPETRIYTLDIPNKEIKVGLFDNLLPNYVDGVSAERGNVAIAKMALLIGKRNMDGALHLLQDFLGTVPYCNVTNYEGHLPGGRGGAYATWQGRYCAPYQDRPLCG